MKPSDEKWMRWLDGELEDEERHLFEEEIGRGQEQERARREHEKHRALLRNALAAPDDVPYPDFFSYRLREKIQEMEAHSEQRTAPRRKWSDLWSKIFSPQWALAVAIVFLGVAILGRQAMIEGRQVHQVIIAQELEEEKSTRVYRVFTPNPDVYATPVYIKKAGATVLWIDGLDYLPENYQVQKTIPDDI